MPESQPTRLAGQRVQLAGSEHCPGAPPHELAALVACVRGNEFGQTVGVVCGWGKSLQDEADTGLTHPETPFLIEVWKVRLVCQLEVRDVVTAQFDKSPSLEVVESLHDARAPEVDRPIAALVTVFVSVLGVDRPAIVECVLRIVDDLANCLADTLRIPSLLDEWLVSVCLEQHAARLDHCAVGTMGTPSVRSGSGGFGTP